ncbi:hypothetical protein ACJ41O_004461 [Fusarium nematophilum]
MPAGPLFARQDTCASDQLSCSTDLVDNWCCAEDSSCMILAGQTTAICCPEGRSCSKIEPIICDVNAQDAEKFPNASIKTIVFNLELAKCGDDGKCCPFGFTCKGGQCHMDEDQSDVPKGAELPSASSTSSPSATSTDPSSAETASSAPSSSSAPGKAADAEQDEPASDNSGPATTSIIGGVVGGCLLLLVLAVIVFLYFRRQKKHQSNNASEKGSRMYGHSRRSSSEASFGNIISEPIVQPNSYRADFILKTPSSRDSRSSVPARQPSNASRIPAAPPRIRISIPNPFDSPNPSPNNPSIQPSPIDDEPLRHGNVRLPPIRAMKASSHISRRPATPELQREPSSESINVFADPSTVVKPRPLTRGTTFTTLMEEADLGDVRRGRPYVPGTTPRI